ncbi:MAG: hypothetical protein KY442_12020 [Proteobacteria bacterium]|nr:hypothetical protein [Pseudomonadota bacterium]
MLEALLRNCLAAGDAIAVFALVEPAQCRHDPVLFRLPSPVRGVRPEAAGEGLELASSPAIYRSDATVRRSAPLQAHPLNRAPRAAIHPDDAQRFGLADGQTVKLATVAGTATLPVEVSTKVAPGTVWVESGHGATASLGAGRVRVRRASA